MIVISIHRWHSSLKRHENGQLPGNSAVSLPKGMNQKQFGVDYSKGLDQFGS
jgi:hypothetical protein